ncbi:hypothetical protein PR202_ga13048 [Eleusine coracana subsp. coracana]|uniref:Uncharacterized protein n=1 Tax=Eleusine coracana subsp. coracana TaxID=191504 RepID=A0AAV5CDW4_ELECO|nr:hypothetical protein PR202_ga13048 [Eleusine coracana subsp. coracana]
MPEQEDRRRCPRRRSPDLERLRRMYMGGEWGSSHGDAAYEEIRGISSQAQSWDDKGCQESGPRIWAVIAGLPESSSVPIWAVIAGLARVQLSSSN